jgi:hypothetical protein
MDEKSFAELLLSLPHGSEELSTLFAERERLAIERCKERLSQIPCYADKLQDERFLRAYAASHYSLWD